MPLFHNFREPTLPLDANNLGLSSFQLYSISQNNISLQFSSCALGFGPYIFCLLSNDGSRWHSLVGHPQIDDSLTIQLHFEIGLDPVKHSVN